MLEPKVDAFSCTMNVNEVDSLTPNKCLVLGSGRERFFERVREPRRDKEGIVDIVKSIVDEDQRVDVGGYLQVGVCSSHGFKNIPLIQTGPDREGVEVNFLGYDISKFRNIVGFEVGYYGIHLPD